MKFITSGYSRIFVTSEEDKQYVKDFFENDNKFGFNFFNDRIFKIVSDFDDIKNLKNNLYQHTKFDGNLDGLISNAKLDNKKILVMVCNDDYDNCYTNNNIDIYLSFDLKQNELKSDIIDIILNTVNIIGIDLIKYKHNLEDSDMFEKISTLIKNEAI